MKLNKTKQNKTVTFDFLKVKKHKTFCNMQSALTSAVALARFFCVYGVFIKVRSNSLEDGSAFYALPRVHLQLQKTDKTFCTRAEIGFTSAGRAALYALPRSRDVPRVFARPPDSEK